MNKLEKILLGMSSDIGLAMTLEKIDEGLAKSLNRDINKAINYMQSCETLRDKEYSKGYNAAIAKIKEEAKYIKR